MSNNLCVQAVYQDNCGVLFKTTRENVQQDTAGNDCGVSKLVYVGCADWLLCCSQTQEGQGRAKSAHQIGSPVKCALPHQPTWLRAISSRLLSFWKSKPQKPRLSGCQQQQYLSQKASQLTPFTVVHRRSSQQQSLASRNLLPDSLSSMI